MKLRVLLLLLPSAILLLAGCERPPAGVAEFPGDAERIKVAADAAARTAQVVTRKLGETYGTNQAINVHIQVGDIVVLGFDEGIDAEEWGMTEISNEGAVSTRAAGTKSAAVQADQAPANAGKRKIARSIDLRKGSIYLVAAEESEAVEEAAPQAPSSPAKPKQP